MISGLRRRVQEIVQGLLRETRGSIALNFALAVPAVAMLSVGAIDLLAVMSAKTRLQDIADAAALAAAPTLGLAADEAAARGRAEAFVVAQLSQWAGAPTVEAEYEVIEQDEERAIQVRLEGHRISFFANMLPPGGWRFEALATAVSVGKTPLCVLGTGTSGRMIDLVGSSRIMAPDCGVHSNAEIIVQGTAQIEGRKIQSVLAATGGGMTPTPGQGAASIADPFASMGFPSLNGCPFTGNGQSNPITYEDNGTHYLDPAIHCRPIIIKNLTTVVLRPGNHFFRKNLQLLGHGRLQGEDVFLFFDHGSDPLFGGMYARVNLIGRKSGPYAGMVMATVAGNSPNIILPGSNVERLLGVVYVRNGFLQVTGNGVAAEDSAWTVIVARQVLSNGVARIRINADYDGSDVPVPIGVGPNAGGMGASGTRLVN
ncbi:pilus assembly protein TadG-related protein [Brevundimonas sp.]|uniref:pilus assembly protein TadG-related protein n=1 Tax=Brevundimonas sp. TaxID=1871086 RepID=UPI002604ABCE|nr:pilus assembly protein TadG-related protein [Brevundimonas sp.]